MRYDTDTLLLQMATFAVFVASYSFYSRVCDKSFSKRKHRKKKNNKTNNNLPPHITREHHKIERRKKLMDQLSMDKPMYDNIKMLNPSGDILTTISKKKADWYIKKNLAKWIITTGYERTTSTTDEEGAIQLLFEPKHQSSKASIYATTNKVNQCVICSSAENHIRHYIVPYSYRRLFPHVFKSHLSHDVVILCGECHVSVSRETQRRMIRIEDSYRVKLNNHEPHMLQNQELYNVQKYASALYKFRNNLPVEKVEQYEATIRAHLNLAKNEEIDSSHLQGAMNVEYRTLNPSYIGGPELVTTELLQQGESAIGEFVRDWRIFFMETARPFYMPVGWSIESPVKCGES